MSEFTDSDLNHYREMVETVRRDIGAEKFDPAESQIQQLLGDGKVPVGMVLNYNPSGYQLLVSFLKGQQETYENVMTADETITALPNAQWLERYEFHTDPFVVLQLRGLVEKLEAEGFQTRHVAIIDLDRDDVVEELKDMQHFPVVYMSGPDGMCVLINASPIHP